MSTEPLAEQFREAGWERFERRAPERWATAFGESGIASSIEIRPGERDYRLRLTKLGRAIRQELQQRHD